jgi:tetratricopeptide (TPR) repeat protein
MALWRLGRVSEAMEVAREAAKQSPLFVFPHRHEDAEALRTALRLSPDDALAHLLLGTWLASAGRWDEAMEHWTRTTQLSTDTALAMLAWRNIGLMRWHKQHDAPAALAAYSSALDALQKTCPPYLLGAWRLWLERDTILAAGDRPDERLATIESAPDDVKANPQIIARWAEACLRAGRLEQATDIVSRCSFKPWEGEHRARRLWKEAHMQCGHRAKDAGDFAKAREHFESAASYPRHLNIGKPALTDDADALFWAGWCASQAGDSAAARRLLAAAATESQPREATSTDFKRRAADLLRHLA